MSARRSVANPLSRYGDMEEDEMIDEDDYVAQVLQRQRKLADMVAPEDAFVSSLPPKVQERLFATIHNEDSDPEQASAYADLTPPPPPPPRIHMESMFSNVMPPGMTIGGGTFGVDNTTVGFPLLTLDQLLCGGGGNMFNLVEGSVKERKPSNFEPMGGAVTVELGAISGFESPLDFDVSCCLIGADGTEHGFPANWIGKRATHHPYWAASRFVGPPGYVCKPGDRLEFRVYRGTDLLAIGHFGNLDTSRPSPAGDDPVRVSHSPHVQCIHMFLIISCLCRICHHCLDILVLFFSLGSMFPLEHTRPNNIILRLEC
jgi:hypothetical protein